MRFLSKIGPVAVLGVVVVLCLPSRYVSDSQKLTIFLATFGAGALTVAVRSARGIWLPRLRGYWGGPFTGHTNPNDPNRMALGRVSHVGGTLLWTGFGLAALFSAFSGQTSKPSHIGVLSRLFLACIVTGFFLLMAGWLLDSRAHDAARRGPPAPGEPLGTPGERHRWIAVASGTLILLVMIWALLFLK
jgi:hypothetical protein